MLGTRAFNGTLQPGGSYAASLTVAVPDTLEPGVYAVFVAIDAGNAVTETDDTNNRKAALGRSLTVSADDPSAAEIAVANTPPAIQNGDTQPAAAKATWFGEVEIGHSITREFVIENPGAGTLHLTGNPPVQVSGEHSNEFEVTVQPNPTVLPGEAMEFTVRFTPLDTGATRAVLNIPNNDADKASFHFAVSGTGGMQR